MSLSLSGRLAERRATILRFLQERRDGKLEQLAADDPQRQSLMAQFEFATWIDDAARRVGQIQAVTHSLKATHPDARGTNFYRPPEGLTKHEAAGSHHLVLSIPTPRAGQAFMKKLCISVIRPYNVMPFRLDWKPSEVLFLVRPRGIGTK